MLRQELEALIGQPVESEEQEQAISEAGRLLVELLKLEGRARQLLVQARRPGAGVGNDLAGLTLHDAARRILEEEGSPLHARDLGTRIKARGWRHPRGRPSRPDQIVFQLAARLPRHPDVFRRVGPNTFALAAWGAVPPGKEARKARTGLFAGSGAPVSERIGEEPDAPFEEPWRSS